MEQCGDNSSNGRADSNAAEHNGSMGGWVTSAFRTWKEQRGYRHFGIMDVTIVLDIRYHHT